MCHSNKPLAFRVLVPFESLLFVYVNNTGKLKIFLDRDVYIPKDIEYPLTKQFLVLYLLQLAQELHYSAFFNHENLNSVSPPLSNRKSSVSIFTKTSIFEGWM